MRCFLKLEHMNPKIEALINETFHAFTHRQPQKSCDLVVHEVFEGQGVAVLES